MPNIFRGELILLQRILTFFKGKVLTKGVNKQISIFGANGAVACSHGVLEKRGRYVELEAHCATMALASVRGGFGGWGWWKGHDNDHIHELFYRILKLDSHGLFKVEYALLLLSSLPDRQPCVSYIRLEPRFYPSFSRCHLIKSITTSHAVNLVDGRPSIGL